MVLVLICEYECGLKESWGSSRATTNLYARLEKEKVVNICIDQSVEG